MKLENRVILYGELVTEIEFRSKTEAGSDLYEFSISTQNKSIKGGRIRVTGVSRLSVIVECKDDAEFQEKLGSFEIGDNIKIEGMLVQDKVGRLGTLSTYAKKVSKYEIQAGDINYARINGYIVRDLSHSKFDNGSERVSILIEQKFADNSGFKAYISSWNNLAQKILSMGLKTGDPIRIVGNLISRKYLDKRSGKEADLSEILARRVEKVVEVEKEPETSNPSNNK